jgi:tyrosyl-tRNA synthetase
MDVQDILAYFERTTEQFLSKDEFTAKLRSGKQLRIKYGVDVKTPTLHIGHAVNLWLIRRLQDAGHRVVIVFADFTSRVGDLDGRLETISDIPPKEVEKNIQEIIRQAKMILRFDDPKLIEIRRNSEWYGQMGIQDIMNLFSLVTHAKLISRDTFQMQMAQGKEIYINELLYPVLQGYDSHMVRSDITIVGSDQLFNESIGRLLQEKHKRKPQTLMTTVMTPGIDGRSKQSQRRDNDIALSHSPRDKFGRVMSIPDTLIEEYFRVYTEVPLEKIGVIRKLLAENPRDAKIELATAIVARYHGPDIAQAERDWFDSTISKGYIPEDLPALILTTDHMDTLDLVVLARPKKSRSDTRRLIQQGGVELNGRKLRNPGQELYLKNNDTLQAGRRNWFRIRVEKLPKFETARLSIVPMRLTDINRVASRIPQADISKYIVRFGNAKKKTAQATTEAFKKILLHPEPRDEWMWMITSKADPENVIGVAYLRGDTEKGLQNIWLDPGVVDEAGIVDEIMLELSEYTLSRLDPKGEVFKNAFAYATSMKNPEALHYAFRLMNTSVLSKEDALEGTLGFTHDGWRQLQEWRRVTSPWLFPNDPRHAPDPQNSKKTEPVPPK